MAYDSLVSKGAAIRRDDADGTARHFGSVTPVTTNVTSRQGSQCAKTLAFKRHATRLEKCPSRRKHLLFCRDF